MTKKKISQLVLSLPLLFLFIIGCDLLGKITSTKSGSGSSSGTTAQDQPAHGQATINLMEKDIFIGDKLNTSYITWLEGYCKAGPTQLIIADMPLIPGQFTRSIASGYWAAQMFALASTYAGVFSSHFDMEELVWFFENQDQIYAWWDRYISAILSIMQKAPQTTALIVTNDEPDRCGARLGYAIQSRLASVNNRVTLGDVLDEWAKIRRK
ncbi:MAG: hypothetical protein A2Y79_12805 [Deltaproteobacteria bacterium RBG_13_43_22]|nr:MAG: hypothetical protein A2Y79_12805 [Deltaproteobacteria bacterium RBG_13_43_22]